MANTYTLISSVTVGSGGASSIDFTSIPATYTDLILKVTGRASSNANNFFITFNGSSAATYNDRTVYGNGSGANSDNNASYSSGIRGLINQSGYTASTFASGEIYIPNYTSSNYKSLSEDIVQETNASTAYSYLLAGLWANTAAITQITLTPASGQTWAQYSTAYLYGIKNS